MQTSLEILAGLIAVKELEIKTLKERVAHLNHQIELLTAENDQLYAIIAQEAQEKDKQDHKIGFKGGAK